MKVENFIISRCLPVDLHCCPMKKGYLVHTNHYLDPHMKEIESEPDELIATRVRYWRALRLLSQTNNHTIKSLQTIQKDHINYPDSICNHDVVGEALDREKTITALDHRSDHTAALCFPWESLRKPIQYLPA